MAHDDGYRDEDRRRGSRDEDRGFIERTGDEVRSWFGDEDAERRRELDRREGGGRDWGRPTRWRGDENAFGGGWGNQRPRGRFHEEEEGGFGDDFGPPPGARRDPHFAEWRNRQIEELDRDYEEYRREHQSRFDQEFSAWRERRNRQRKSMEKVREHMEVIGSDGEHIGTVDKVRGEHIVLTRSDENAGGVHHSIPCSWIESVDDKVRVNRTADQAMEEWRVEDRSRALFEREDSGSPGPHMLNRSFSGTYRDRGD